MKVLAISTPQREAFVDVTQQVNEIVKTEASKNGACLIFCPHTTAGVTINECADPAVVLDMRKAFNELVDEDNQWLHLEGNSPAHAKASLMGSSVTIPIEDGKLVLGRWQGIFLCEFDGPRTREVWVRVLS